MQPFINNSKYKRQQGAAIVEFAIIAVLLFTMLFAILELGRLFYMQNAVQEVTRRAAREATVRWVTEEYQARELAMFGASNLPGGAEVTIDNIRIEYLDVNRQPLGSLPATSLDNVTACLSNEANCIAYVRASITNASYNPMVPLFSFFSVPIPASTVIMPAESLGLYF